MQSHVQLLHSFWCLIISKATILQSIAPSLMNRTCLEFSVNPEDVSYISQVGLINSAGQWPSRTGLGVCYDNHDLRFLANFWHNTNLWSGEMVHFAYTF